MKVCRICNIEKRSSEYYYARSNKDNLRHECKDCVKEYSKRRYKVVGHIMRQQMADQRNRDYEHRIEIERRSRAKNKEKYRASRNARQQVRNRLLGGSKFTILDKELKRLYREPCYMCGSTENQSIDHIIPLSRGGNHSIGNLMTLCRSCNCSKHGRFFTEWKYKQNYSEV